MDFQLIVNIARPNIIRKSQYELVSVVWRKMLQMHCMLRYQKY